MVLTSQTSPKGLRNPSVIRSFFENHQLAHTPGQGFQSLDDLQKFHTGDFPGGPVATTPCSQYKGPKFNLWSGN